MRPAPPGALALLLASALLLGGQATAQEIRAFPAGPGTVAPADLASHHVRYAGKEGYLERWMFMIHRADGGWMQVAFILSNTGLGDGHCVVDVQRHAPTLGGKSGGKHELERMAQKFQPGQFKASTSALSVKIDKSWLRPTRKGYRAYVYAWGYELELNITTRSAPWKPGSLGGIDFPGGGEYRVQLLSAHGRVTGRERKRGGAWAPLSGAVWGEHAATNMMPHQLANRWLRYTGHHGPWTVSYQEVFTPAKWDKQRFGWVVVTRAGAVVASGLAARMTRQKTRRESAAPNHRVPIRYEVKADTDAGPLTLTVRLGDRLHREEVLKPLPKFIRSVIEMFVQPVMFYDRARFDLEVGDQRVRGRTGVSVYAPLRAR